MPKILEDRVKAIGRDNPSMPKSNRWAIATSSLQKQGKLPKKGGSSTAAPAFCEGGKVLSSKNY
jgi:hypothetical protein